MFRLSLNIRFERNYGKVFFMFFMHMCMLRLFSLSLFQEGSQCCSADKVSSGVSCSQICLTEKLFRGSSSSSPESAECRKQFRLTKIALQNILHAKLFCTLFVSQFHQQLEQRLQSLLGKVFIVQAVLSTFSVEIKSEICQTPKQWLGDFYSTLSQHFVKLTPCSHIMYILLFHRRRPSSCINSGAESRKKSHSFSLACTLREQLFLRSDFQLLQSLEALKQGVRLF